MTRNFRAEDEGKRVVTADGDEIGTVEQVVGAMAHVRPSGNLSQSVRRRLGWAEDADTYELRTSTVDVITSDEIALRRNL